MVHLAGDLVQPAVAQHQAVLGDGAPRGDLACCSRLTLSLLVVQVTASL